MDMQSQELVSLLKEARTLLRTHARAMSKDWDRRATAALATHDQRPAEGYRVLWVIDLTTDTAMAAAQKAREIQLDPQSTATVFTVIGAKGLGTYQFDLPTVCN